MQLAAIGREAVAALPAPIAPPQPMPDGYRDLLGYYGGDNFRADWCGWSGGTGGSRSWIPIRGAGGRL